MGVPSTACAGAMAIGVSLSGRAVSGVGNSNDLREKNIETGSLGADWAFLLLCAQFGHNQAAFAANQHNNHAKAK